MANKKSGEILVELDKTRVLKFGLNAFAAFEDEMWVTIPAYLMEFSEKTKGDPGAAMRFFGFKQIRAMLWAGLLHQDQTLTPAGAGDLADKAPGETWQDKAAYLIERVFTAFAGAQEPISKKKGSEEA